MTEQQILLGPGMATTTASPAWRLRGMVADAQELVADEPDVPVVESVTHESPREETAA